MAENAMTNSMGYPRYPGSGKPRNALGGKYAWFIWSLTAIAFGYAFFQRVAPGVMVSDLMADFAIGAGVLGTLSALYFYPYVLLQIPLGVLLDRFGARLLLSCALLIAGVGSVIFATATDILPAYLGRLLIGTGSAVGFLGSLAIASKWFPPHRFALLSGMVMLVGMLTGVMAQGPLSYFVEGYGWRTAMWGLGVFSLVLALLVVVFVRNAPDGATLSSPSSSSNQLWKNLGLAFGSLEVWKIAIVASTMSGPMLTLAGLWGPPYLSAAYGLDTPAAAGFVSTILIGWALAAPFAGWLSDRIRRRKAILVSGCLVLLVAVGLVCFVQGLPLFVTVFLFAVIGASGACMSVTFALARENSDPEIGGAVSGIVNSLTVASGAILQPAVGFLIEQVWSGTTRDNLPVYSALEFRTGFILVFVSCVIGLLISLTLKESDFAKKTAK